MDFRRSSGKYPPVPSRRSSDGGAGNRLPIPYQPPSDRHSGSGGGRNEDIPPQPESKDRQEPTPPILRIHTPCLDHTEPSTSILRVRSTRLDHTEPTPPIPGIHSSYFDYMDQPPSILRCRSSNSHNTPARFPDHSNTSHSSSRAKRTPSNLSPGPEYIPAQVVDLYRHPGRTHEVNDGEASNRQTSAYLRQATFTEDGGHHRQDRQYPQDSQDQPNQRHRKTDTGQQTEPKTMLEKKSSEMKSQKSLHKGQSKHHQKATTPTPGSRPEWKITSRAACKPMSIYPEPLTPLPPIPKYKPPSVRPSEARMRHESDISAKQSQVSARMKPTKASVQRGRTGSRPSAEIRSTSGPADLQEPYEERRRSEESNDRIPTVPQERSGTQLVSGPSHNQDENVPFDAVNSSRGREVDCTVKPSTERIREECANLMQKLTAELALTKAFPSDTLCVRLSLSEQLTEDGTRRSFTICEPSCRLPADRSQEECPEIYATPSAPSPRPSILERAGPQQPIRAAPSYYEAKFPAKEPAPQQRQQVPLPPQDEETVPKEESPPPRSEDSVPQVLPPKRKSSPITELRRSIIQEVVPVPSRTQIVPPKSKLCKDKKKPTPPEEAEPEHELQLEQEPETEPEQEPETEPEQEPETEPEQEPPTEPEQEPEPKLEPEPTPVAPSVEEILPPTTPAWTSAPEDFLPLRSSEPEQEERVENTTFTAEPCGSRKDPQVCPENLGGRQTIEMEALNTEFLYYSSALKNLLPLLSCPEDRSRLVPWVKKLFSPEYCARLLRDKRNRFLLHLVVVLCNDEVIGIFRNPPPEGTIPSVDELCSTRYPPAAWECDSAWLDHLGDVPPGVARMPCPWHKSGCPENNEQPAKPEGSCPDICYPWRQYGTSCEVARGWSLDQEFKLLLYFSRPLKPLMKMSKDRLRMVSWLRYLCTVTPDCCITLRSLRNDYIKLLLAYGQDDRMTGPFAREPVWGVPLPALGDHGDGIQARPFADPASGDVDEFLRSVPIPNEGMTMNTDCMAAILGCMIQEKCDENFGTKNVMKRLIAHGRPFVY